MNKDRYQNKKNAGLALIWVVIIAFGIITVLGMGRAIKKQEEEQKQPPMGRPSSEMARPTIGQEIKEQATEEKEETEKTPRLITKGPCAKDLNSKECEDYIGRHCRENPRSSECLEAFHYAGAVACEQNPNSQDCQLYQEHKNQAQPATGLTKEMQATLNRIRTFPFPFLDQPSFNQPGPKYTYDYEDYFFLQDEANFGHIYPGHPDYQYYQELQQQFGQPELPPVYLNPLNNPDINPLANPDINPLMNPDINPLANPDINPMADPSLNPGCIPCQAGFGGGRGSGWSGWGGGFGGWGR